MHNDTILPEYRGDKLRLARLINGYSLDDLGEKLSVTRQNIHKMEAGQEPKEEQLKLLCKHLSVQTCFFYSERNTPVIEDQCHFRSLRSRTKTLTSTIMARAELLDSLIKEVEKHFELPDFKLPATVNLEIKTPEDIEKASEALRRHWDLGTGPIANMTIIVENAGIIVTTVEGANEKVDAFSMSRQRPIIIRNSAKNSPCRYRFDLAHELGHLVMHDGIVTGCKTTEKQANHFASAFLMPRTSFLSAVERFPIIKGVKSINWHNLYKLKLYFKVSFKALLYRAKFLSLINDNHMRSGYISINKKGWAKIEYLDDKIPVETSSHMESMLQTMDYKTWKIIVDKLGFTNKLISELLPSISQPRTPLRSIT